MLTADQIESFLDENHINFTWSNREAKTQRMTQLLSGNQPTPFVIGFLNSLGHERNKTYSDFTNDLHRVENEGNVENIRLRTFRQFFTLINYIDDLRSDDSNHDVDVRRTMAFAMEYVFRNIADVAREALDLTMDVMYGAEPARDGSNIAVVQSLLADSPDVPQRAHADPLQGFKNKAYYMLQNYPGYVAQYAPKTFTSLSPQNLLEIFLAHPEALTTILQHTPKAFEKLSNQQIAELYRESPVAARAMVANKSMFKKMIKLAKTEYKEIAKAKRNAEKAGEFFEEPMTLAKEMILNCHKDVLLISAAEKLKKSIPDMVVADAEHVPASENTSSELEEQYHHFRSERERFEARLETYQLVIEHAQRDALQRIYSSLSTFAIDGVRVLYNDSPIVNNISEFHGRGVEKLGETAATAAQLLSNEEINNITTIIGEKIQKAKLDAAQRQGLRPGDMSVDFSQAYYDALQADILEACLPYFVRSTDVNGAEILGRHDELLSQIKDLEIQIKAARIEETRIAAELTNNYAQEAEAMEQVTEAGKMVMEADLAVPGALDPVSAEQAEQNLNNLLAMEGRYANLITPQAVRAIFEMGCVSESGDTKKSHEVLHFLARHNPRALIESGVLGEPAAQAIENHIINARRVPHNFTALLSTHPNVTAAMYAEKPDEFVDLFSKKVEMRDGTTRRAITNPITFLKTQPWLRTPEALASHVLPVLYACEVEADKVEAFLKSQAKTGKKTLFGFWDKKESHTRIASLKQKVLYYARSLMNPETRDQITVQEKQLFMKTLSNPTIAEEMSFTREELLDLVQCPGVPKIIANYSNYVLAIADRMQASPRQPWAEDLYLQAGLVVAQAMDTKPWYKTKQSVAENFLAITPLNQAVVKVLATNYPAQIYGLLEVRRWFSRGATDASRQAKIRELAHKSPFLLITLSQKPEYAALMERMGHPYNLVVWPEDEDEGRDDRPPHREITLELLATTAAPDVSTAVALDLDAAVSHVNFQENSFIQSELVSAITAPSIDDEPLTVANINVPDFTEHFNEHMASMLLECNDGFLTAHIHQIEINAANSFTSMFQNEVGVEGNARHVANQKMIERVLRLNLVPDIAREDFAEKRNRYQAMIAAIVSAIELDDGDAIRKLDPKAVIKLLSRMELRNSGINNRVIDTILEDLNKQISERERLVREGFDIRSIEIKIDQKVVLLRTIITDNDTLTEAKESARAALLQIAFADSIKGLKLDDFLNDEGAWIADVGEGGKTVSAEQVYELIATNPDKVIAAMTAWVDAAVKAEPIAENHHQLILEANTSEVDLEELAAAEAEARQAYKQANDLAVIFDAFANFDGVEERESARKQARLQTMPASFLVSVLTVLAELNPTDTHTDKAAKINLIVDNISLTQAKGLIGTNDLTEEIKLSLVARLWLAPNKNSIKNVDLSLLFNEDGSTIVPSPEALGLGTDGRVFAKVVTLEQFKNLFEQHQALGEEVFRRHPKIVTACIKAVREEGQILAGADVPLFIAIMNELSRQINTNADLEQTLDDFISVLPLPFAKLVLKINGDLHEAVAKKIAYRVLAEANGDELAIYDEGSDLYLIPLNFFLPEGRDGLRLDLNNAHVQRLQLQAVSLGQVNQLLNYSDEVASAAIAALANVREIYVSNIRKTAEASADIAVFLRMTLNKIETRDACLAFIETLPNHHVKAIFDLDFEAGVNWNKNDLLVKLLNSPESNSLADLDLSVLFSDEFTNEFTGVVGLDDVHRKLQTKELTTKQLLDLLPVANVDAVPLNQAVLIGGFIHYAQNSQCFWELLQPADAIQLARINDRNILAQLPTQVLRFLLDSDLVAEGMKNSVRAALLISEDPNSLTAIMEMPVDRGAGVVGPAAPDELYPDVSLTEFFDVSTGNLQEALALGVDLIPGGKTITEQQIKDFFTACETAEDYTIAAINLAGMVGRVTCIGNTFKRIIAAPADERMVAVLLNVVLTSGNRESYIGHLNSTFAAALLALKDEAWGQAQAEELGGNVAVVKELVQTRLDNDLASMTEAEALQMLPVPAIDEDLDINTERERLVRFIQTNPAIAIYCLTHFDRFRTLLIPEDNNERLDSTEFPQGFMGQLIQAQLDVEEGIRNVPVYLRAMTSEHWQEIPAEILFSILESQDIKVTSVQLLSSANGTDAPESKLSPEQAAYVLAEEAVSSKVAEKMRQQLLVHSDLNSLEGVADISGFFGSYGSPIVPMPDGFNKTVTSEQVLSILNKHRYPVRVLCENPIVLEAYLTSEVEVTDEIRRALLAYIPGLRDGRAEQALLAQLFNSPIDAFRQAIVNNARALQTLFPQHLVEARLQAIAAELGCEVSRLNSQVIRRNNLERFGEVAFYALALIHGERENAEGITTLGMVYNAMQGDDWEKILRFLVDFGLENFAVMEDGFIQALIGENEEGVITRLTETLEAQDGFADVSYAGITRDTAIIRANLPGVDVDKIQLPKDVYMVDIGERRARFAVPATGDDAVASASASTSVDVAESVSAMRPRAGAMRGGHRRGRGGISGGWDSRDQRRGRSSTLFTSVDSALPRNAPLPVDPMSVVSAEKSPPRIP